MKLFTVIFLVFNLLCSSSAFSATDSTTDSTTDMPTTIYMVRHGEKVKGDNPDPSLNTAGFARAEALKAALIDASVDAIIVSINPAFKYRDNQAA